MSRIIVVGRNWRELEAEPTIGGLRGHNLFLASLTPEQQDTLAVQLSTLGEAQPGRRLIGPYSNPVSP